jgi:hypothetical protein
MYRLVVLLGLLTAGCATSLAGLGEKEPRLRLTSTRPAEQIAACLVTSLNWSNEMLRFADDHFVIVRNNNAYNIPMIRWDIIGTETGSTIELRATHPFGEGADKARSCAAATG